METILVVDDSATTLQMTKKALEGAGYRVVTCSSGMSSSQAYHSEKPDLVLMDVEMPGLEGSSVVEILKRTAPGKTAAEMPPIYLYSSLPDAELRKRVESCGADGYLTKSDAGDVLVAHVRHILLREKLKRRNRT